MSPPRISQRRTWQIGEVDHLGDPLAAVLGVIAAVRERNSCRVMYRLSQRRISRSRKVGQIQILPVANLPIVWTSCRAARSATS